MRASTSIIVLGLVTGTVIACGPHDRTGSGDPDAGAPGDTDASVNTETCGDGLDNDGDSSIDEMCPCTPGLTQACYPGAPTEIGVGPCRQGTQTCLGEEEFGDWGPCTDAIGPSPELCNTFDDDCDGTADDGLPDCMIVEVTVDIDGDCVYASCPAQAPYPIGCNITMEGGDPRGCVALNGTSGLYFQEGDNCGAGHVSGTLLCSTQPGGPLDEMNCAINKPEKFYPADPSGCPDVN